MLAYHPEEAHPLVEAFLADQLPGRTPPLAIDAGDSMFRYIEKHCHGDRDAALVDYLRTGVSAARTLAPLLRTHLASRARPARVLDFAAGYGRVTRFLLGDLAGAELTVSDVVAEAVAFQCQRFGVQGVVSTRRPEDLILAGGFDAIVVASLFSHLPRSTFTPWLRRLAALLAPGGLLAVSTHDLSHNAGWEAREVGGFAYTALNETEEGDGEHYGTAWVSESFVAGAVASIPGHFGYRRLALGLWHSQDLYLIARQGEVDLAALPLDRGPTGELWAAKREGGAALWVAGWAIDAEDLAGEVSVRVALDGGPAAEVTPDEERAEVVRRIGLPTAVRCGWQCRVAPRRGSLRSSQTLLVKAVTSRGSEAVLFLGSVESALARLEARGLRGELAAAERELQWSDHFLRENAATIAELRSWRAAVRGSRFWRTWTLWLHLRRRLGLDSLFRPRPPASNRPFESDGNGDDG